MRAPTKKVNRAVHGCVTTWRLAVTPTPDGPPVPPEATPVPEKLVERAHPLTPFAKAWLVVVAVCLAAVATAAAGPVAFVAFLAGPIARRLTGGGGLALVPSALVGSVIVMAADFAGAQLFGTRLPVGVITGVLGAPFLLWLLATANRVGKGG